MLSIILTNLGIVLVLTFLLWLLSLKLEDVSIVDIFWGLGFVVLTWVSAFAEESWSSRATLLLVMITIWGIRLAIYLAWRNIGEPEDRRYRAMRKHWRQWFWIVSLFSVFWLQAIVLWIVSLPVQLGTSTTSDLGWLDWLGFVVWATGLFFETIGDWQLARFKANPDNADEVLNRGLWRYTRHPNYFGDFLVWWGLYFVAASAGFWWTIFSPLLMSVLLMKISGVSLLEKSLTNRKPKYGEYARRTNAFFPGPPKPVASDTT